jgi:hypothetical protein
MEVTNYNKRTSLSLRKKRNSRRRLTEYFQNPPISNENETPKIAELAALDYKLNGGRARSNTGDFIGPRWVVDQEVMNCFSCSLKFNLIARRK